jgi:hypothetical protein
MATIHLDNLHVLARTGRATGHVAVWASLPDGAAPVHALDCLLPAHPPAWQALGVRADLGIGDRLVRAEALAPCCKKTRVPGEVQACRLADQRIAE